MSTQVQDQPTITLESIREFEATLKKMKKELAKNKQNKNTTEKTVTLTPVDIMMHEFLQPVKNNKSVVRRMTCFNETSENKNTLRKGTIVYEYNFKTKTLNYAASIFKTTLHQPEHFDRSKHLNTAIRRFNKHPVQILNFVDEPGFTGADLDVRKNARHNFNVRIRKQLFKSGCRSGKAQSDTNSQYSDDTN